MSHYPRVVCVRMPGRQISTLFYLHVCSPTINTHNSRHYPFEHVSCEEGERKLNVGLILKKKILPFSVYYQTDVNDLFGKQKYLFN